MHRTVPSSRALGLVFGAALLLLARSTAAAGPITKGPWVQRVTSNSAVIRVEVDPPQPVSVELGRGGTVGAAPVTDAGDHRVEAAGSVEKHSLHAIPLNNLEPSTRYSYAVKVGPITKLASFTTAPRDDSDAAFRFLVYGDNRTDDAAHAAVVRAMVSAASDFVMHTGDFVEYGASLTQWQTFFDIESPLLGTRCIFSCVGNHELTDGAGIEYARFFGPTEVPPDLANPPAPPRKGAAGKLFGPNTPPAATRPEHFAGTFRWGNARFFLVNGMVSLRGATADRTWMEKVLTDADEEPNLKWRIVVTHHGPWSSGPHGSNQRLHEAGILPLFKTHKVDLVLSGHDHIYERGWGDPGLAYIVSGGGGAPVYKVKAAVAQSRKLESVRHFVEVAVNSSSLQINATRVDGSNIERCALTKNATLGWDCDGPSGAGQGQGPSSTAANASANRPSRSGGDGGPSSRCSCEVVGSRGTPPTTQAIVSVLVGALAMLRRRRTRTRIPFC